MNLSYQEKYSKYKQKYLELKKKYNLVGGNDNLEEYNNALNIVKKNGMNLQHIPEKYKKDENIALEAIYRNGSDSFKCYLLLQFVINWLFITLTFSHSSGCIVSHGLAPFSL